MLNQISPVSMNPHTLAASINCKGLRGSERPEEDLGDAGLRKACAEFESLFIGQLLKSMRNTLPKDGLLGNSNESKIINGMFDENLALVMARGGGIGVGRALFEQMRDRG